jgi:phage-related protein
MGTSFKDLCDDGIFPIDARRSAGYQLRQVQRGEDPDDWKPFDEAIYVLHCFKKKTPKTSLKDKDLATQRYKKMLLSRIKT